MRPPFTSLPLTYTASPAYDNNPGWLAYYPTLFDYSTVLMWFQEIAKILPFLHDADRLYLAGAREYGFYSVQLAERSQYHKMPSLLVRWDGCMATFVPEHVSEGEDIVEHTKTWLCSGWNWLLEQVSSSPVEKQIRLPTCSLVWLGQNGVSEGPDDGPEGAVTSSDSSDA